MVLMKAALENCSRKVKTSFTSAPRSAALTRANPRIREAGSDEQHHRERHLCQSRDRCGAVVSATSHPIALAPAVNALT